MAVTGEAGVYGSGAFRARLGHVRAVAGREGLDAVVAVTGIDARHDEGMRRFANYLLLGYSGGGIAHEPKDRNLARALEELVMIITPDTMAIVAPPHALAHLVALTAASDNVRLFVLPASGSEPPASDELDEFKAATFVHAIDELLLWPPAPSRAKPRVGLPALDLDAEDGRQFEPMDAERWPLVQAYGYVPLDGSSTHTFRPVGVAGFFSMVFDVVGIHKLLTAQVYPACDVQTLASAHHVAHSQLAPNWELMLSTMDAASARLTLYRYGMVGREVPGATPPAVNVVQLGSHCVATVSCTEPSFGVSLARTLFVVNAPTSDVPPDMPQPSAAAATSDAPAKPRSFSLFSFHPGFNSDSDDESDSVDESDDGVGDVGPSDDAADARVAALFRIYTTMVAALPRVAARFVATLSGRDGGSVMGDSELGRVARSELGSVLPDAATVRGSVRLTSHGAFNQRIPAEPLPACPGLLAVITIEVVANDVVLSHGETYAVSGERFAAVSEAADVQVWDKRRRKLTVASAAAACGLGAAVSPHAVPGVLSAERLTLDGSVSVFEGGLVFGSRRTGLMVVPLAMPALLPLSVATYNSVDADSGATVTHLDVVMPSASLASAAARLGGLSLGRLVACGEPVRLSMTFDRAASGWRMVARSAYALWRPLWDEGEVVVRLEMPTVEPAESLPVRLEPSFEDFAVCASLGAKSKTPVAIEHGEHAVPVTVVCGAACAGADTLVASLIETSSERHQWSVVSSALDDEALFDDSAWAARVRDAATEARSAVEPRTGRVALVAPAYVDVAAVTTMLEGPGMRDEVFIASVVALVHPVLHQMPSGRVGACAPLLPNAASLLRRGFVQAVVVRMPEAKDSDHSIETTRASVAARNPEASMVMGSHSGRVVHPAAVDELLRLDAWQAASQAELRALCSPDLEVAASVAARHVTLVVARLPMVLDEACLLRVLRNLLGGSVAGPDGTPLQVTRVRGMATITSDGSAVWRARVNGSSLLSPADAHEAVGASSARGMSGVSPSVEFVELGDGQHAESGSVFAVDGSYVTKRAVVTALLDARVPLPVEKPTTRTAASLSQAEIADIRAASKDEPVPDGFFFDGRAYVDADGGRWFDHPRLGVLKAEFVARTNAAAEAHNAHVADLAAHRAAEARQVFELNGCSPAELDS
ncbi:uncharacterized protein AMSG_02257 [Thecamonas trahens ATCC 50062]|uniref:Uncharacterized protein n=1 Tax=Thecamonas trahens ATCC 50062 TaxID=461836 RepID=A0A0L0DXM3_THETB|nr:hypothetical protein AMSG_02257 [Thecamonas trahens ATCC 50062]KNC56288.1 hypothetical protein AMSG_02257 [Thecamonas trahens ATCC 50062]|eukprot:XP_013760807.1 hypothetical protein AMSG_02257 [Thecamonas trahens ATCC 50062]